MPEQVPRLGNAFTRCIGRWGLRALGWRVRGDIPNVPKAVFAAAPHTSNWDFVIAMLAVVALGVKISYLMKKEAFFWPFRSLFITLGGIPIDRKAASDTVEQICSSIEAQSNIWVVITPEGTRSKVEKWKTGFLRVADVAKVPVVLVAWNYPDKTVYVDRLWQASSDHIKDAQEIRDYINQRYQGRHLDRQ